VGLVNSLNNIYINLQQGSELNLGLGFSRPEARVLELKSFFISKILEYSRGLTAKEFRKMITPEEFPGRSSKQAIRFLRRGKIGAFDVGELAGFTSTSPS